MRPCLSPRRKETGCSEWQVNWWDLQPSWSGPDVEARRAMDGMPANPPLFRTPPTAGAALQREEGPVQVSTFTIWLFPLQPQPHKGWVYFYWLRRLVACARCSSRHQRRNVSGQALERLCYSSKQRVDFVRDVQNDQSWSLAIRFVGSINTVKLMNVTNWWWFSGGSGRRPRNHMSNRTQLNQMSPFCVLEQNLNKAFNLLAGS